VPNQRPSALGKDYGLRRSRGTVNSVLSQPAAARLAGAPAVIMLGHPVASENAAASHAEYH